MRPSPILLWAHFFLARWHAKADAVFLILRFLNGAPRLYKIDPYSGVLKRLGTAQSSSTAQNCYQSLFWSVWEWGAAGEASERTRSSSLLIHRPLTRSVHGPHSSVLGTRAFPVATRDHLVVTRPFRALPTPQQDGKLARRAIVQPWRRT